MKNNTPIVLATAAALLMLPVATQAAVVTLNAGDSFGQSSFVNGTNWSDTTVPSASNTYEVNVADRRLRTPQDGTSNTFAGSSLTLNGGLLFLKGNAGTTTTVNSLFVNGGGVNLEGATAGTSFLAGTVTIQAGGLTFNSTSSSTLALGVTASIGGGGALTQTYTPAGGTTTVNLQSANSYAGGTFVTRGALGAQVNGSLGTGNVTVSGGTFASTLTLGTGTSSSNYIDDLAQLILTGGTINPIVNLNFTGQDTLASINYFGTIYTTPGTYGAIGSDAGTELAAFQGPGYLEIVPEPSSLFLVALSAIGLLTRRR